ncbi:MAG: DUF808 domain-containing protein [Pseudomonadota bacterium]
MAGASLLVLLDDIASVLDDVAAMTKIAARKTAGVLGDDLAVNAEKVTGVRAEREIPVVWAVAKGSFRNKLILVPAALILSFIAPWIITPVLVLGGLFLCYEGFEKIVHSLFHKDKTKAKTLDAEKRLELATTRVADLAKFEQERVSGAIRTDFILSLEIIVITLGIVAAQTLVTQFLVLAGIAILMTAGVYGLVAGIVKLDDAGLYLSRREGQTGWARFLRWFGERLVAFAPDLMKGLTIIGTVAMFMVGGGILVHAFHQIDEQIAVLAGHVAGLSAIGPTVAVVIPTLMSTIVGVIAGALVLSLIAVLQRMRSDK